MIILVSLISGVLTALAGWLGGRGDSYADDHGYPRWPFQSWVRDAGVSTVTCLAAFLLGVHSWLLIPAMGMMYGATSSYRYFLKKPKDYTWPYYALHGFMIGLAAFPIAIATGHWWLWGLRCALLALWMGGWSVIWKNAHIEEAGRYAPVGATIFMIC